MKTVTINKIDLLVRINENRNNHRAAFEKAFEGYRRECIRILQHNLDMLKAGSGEAVVFRECPPEDHTGDYDTVIKMLNMSVDENIVLTHQEFCQYVEDDWNWKASWSMANSKYYAQ